MNNDNEYNNRERNYQEWEPEGLYRDPRERFQSSRGYEGVNGGPGGQNGGGRATWHKGETKVKKPSPPVNLTRRSLAVIIAACLVLSCLCGLGGAWIGLHASDSDTPASTESGTSSVSKSYTLEDATGSGMTVQEVTELTQDSVVEITTESVQTDSWLQSYVTEGAGSGVIISKDGYIMTNNHVIDGASKVTVTTRGGKSYEAEIVGADSTNDVAVIKVDASDLTAATYGNSDQIKVGDMAVAIGNPLGELGGTVTAGIISAKDRELTIDGATMNLIQTDSSINPGNSGGGLFNDEGQLIGLVVAKSSGSDVEGLGFAIPINTAADVAEQLMDKGYVSGQPMTGMTYTEGSSGIESMFGSSSGSVYIYSVDTAKARLAGFRAGDIVFAINGEQITSIDDVSAIVTAHKVGDKLKYTIVRDGKTKALTITLQEKKN